MNNTEISIKPRRLDYEIQSHIANVKYYHKQAKQKVRKNERNNK